MSGILKAAGLGDGFRDFADAIAKLRLTLPHDPRRRIEYSVVSPV